MSKILYIDTDGTKGSLPAGTLGYDAYAAGGDEGRVAVGTAGGVDVLLAKKSELVIKDQVLSLTGDTVVPDGKNMVLEESLDLNGYDVVLSGSAKIRFETEI